MNRFQIQARQTVVAQLVVVLVVAVLWLWHSQHSGVAALAGGLAAVASNAFFAWRLFRKMEQRSVKQIMAALYINELLKLLGCAVMVIVLLRVWHLALLPLLSGLLAAYLVMAPMAIYQQIKMVSR